MNNVILSPQKFFLYARKSTDVEDKQVRSIEDQITELRAYAKQEQLNIIEELIEKQSAKIPGRPIFNDMLDRIEAKEANGILAWHPDRLARNSVDGGKIIYLLDCGPLAMLKFPTFWSENTSQGKFMLSIAFGQSKYYVDTLSENTKRGLRQKIRRGEYPGFAPNGYLNNPRTKSVEVNSKRAEILRKAFELYAQNDSRLEDISVFLAHQGVTSRNGKLLKRDRISFILSNPFYIGLFRFAGEVYEGNHQPIISKKLFDTVQCILKERSKPQHKLKNAARAFCGLLRCATCSMGITGESKLKRQKNGNEHFYTYYHCTRKNKLMKCTESCIREDSLDEQLSALLRQFYLRDDWAEGVLKMIENDKSEAAQSSADFLKKCQSGITAITNKLQRLLDGYLEQDIDRELYRNEKAKLLSEKKSLEEKMTDLEQCQNGWIEPMKKWIEDAQNMEKIAREGTLAAKKGAAKEIFGSNLLLANRSIVYGGPNTIEKSGQIQWAAVKAAHEMIARNPESCVLEHIYNQARTFFQSNLPTKSGRR